MNTLITFTEKSEVTIKKYLKGKAMFVMVDQDSGNVCAVLKGKTLLEKLPVAIQEELVCEEVKTIELDFKKHNYSIQCSCSILQDGEDEEKVFEITRTVVY